MKKTMKKMFALTMTALMSVGVFAGCRDKKTGEVDPDGKIAISVKISDALAEGELMSAWKKAYEAKNPEVKIKISTLGSDYNEEMMSFVQTPDKMPDIMWTTGETHALWSSEGVFVDLKDIIEADESIDLGDFYDEILKVTHINSKDEGIYFMPRDYNKPVLYVNKVMFREAGISDEDFNALKANWNYEKFLETCETLKNAMDTLNKPETGMIEASVPLDAQMASNASYCSFIKHFGGEFVENGAVNLMSDKNLNAYAKIYELIEKGYIEDSGNKDAASFTYLAAAMRIDVRPNLPDMPMTADYDIDFLPLPLDHVGIGCSGYAITDMARERVSPSEFNEEEKTNEEYAFDFLKFIVSEEGQKIGGKMGSIIPVRKSMANDDSWTSYKDANLNHAAFISAPEKDFSLTVFRDFKVDDATQIADSLAKTMAQVLIRTNFPEGYKTNGYQALKTAITPYQNSIADLRTQY